jgi:two-component system, NarL family, response regulator LiaR
VSHASNVLPPLDGAEATQILKKCAQLTIGKSVAVAMGDCLTLGSFCLLPFISHAVTGAFTEQSEAETFLGEHRPDLLFVTEELLQGYGISLIRRARELSPSTRSLVFLQRETQAVVREALDAGACGVIYVSSIGKLQGQFLKALTAACAGNVYYPEDSLKAAAYKRDERLDELSGRELQVLSCLCSGMSNRDIGGALVLSEDTVKKHVSNVISKLAVADRLQAAIIGIKSGIDTIDAS